MKLDFSIKPRTDLSKFVVQEVKDELLVYNLETNRVFSLNETSRFVWEKCDGTLTAAEIASRLEEDLNRMFPTELAWLTVHELAGHDLVELEKPPENADWRVTRREMAKKVGLATMIALPVIISLSAPTAGLAQSGLVLQQCSVCLTKTHEFTICANTCQDIIVGDCHDNSGCGGGLFQSLVTCQDCLGNLPPNGNASTVSWHGRQYKV